MCFSATLVASGSGKGVVISTGDFTQIGTISSLVQQTEKLKTDVLKQMDTVSTYLATFITITMIITFFVAIFVTGQPWLEAVSTALTCAVAMIPEGLEAIITMTYSYAVTNMARKNAIIRALPAVETLGSVTVICSDKTGTLTQNIMSLTAFVTTNARYKFDVDSTDRVPANFIRDDSYMAERAEHALNKSPKQVVEEGGTNSGEGRIGRVQSNPYLVDSSMHSSGSDDDPPASPAGYDTQTTPFANGESPDATFVSNALKPGILCSKCILGENGA